MKARWLLFLCVFWLGMVMPEPAAMAATAQESLVEQGRRLFFQETFAGNGRTCGTCHPASNDYTLDPAFIARLPARDPLFVAAFDPRLRSLEHPTLLRKLALVMVNADGFTRPAVPRAVPHLLALGRSIQVEPGSLIRPGRTSDLAAATGWSGDGAPGRGSLREFALGSVRQHFTRSMARVAGKDFRLPSSTELRALEAFMRSLGRRDELDIANGSGVTFRAPLVERGRALFNNEVSGPCSFCHRNATALNEGGFNGMFDIGVAQRADAPAHKLDPLIAGDGGFGVSPVIRVAGRTGYGNGRMNTPSLIEAADTPPFFHDNAASTIEAAVEFYTTKTFADSPEGQALPIIRLSKDDVLAIAALLRTLNALENIRSSSTFATQAVGKPAAIARSLLRLGLGDATEAVAVLSKGPRRLYADQVFLIERALKLLRSAVRVPSAAGRDHLLAKAVELQTRAGKAMLLEPGLAQDGHSLRTMRSVAGGERRG
ncbi:MAG TPA: hypothetical protein VHL31_04645 [Geminicoccus sp.]|jgi:cytochrome c peroxidase|uniref:hypothetical protein n=1 Tax=Geminicoccus sp. TaxID=2024832 RepID=UPI002E35EF91|nr:hypothetical protein [Geminicoccus sp.]HEX2525576.1 hypothetical protein [Geminicoccus sp.]